MKFDKDEVSFFRQIMPGYGERTLFVKQVSMIKQNPKGGKG